MMKRLLEAWCGLVTRHPGAVAVVLLLLAALSAAGAARLTINNNQLDLISQDLRQVKDVKRVSDMIGGAGSLVIAVRGRDAAVLKGVADDLAAQLEADTTNVRTVLHKLPTEFLRTRAAMFMSTEDLTEIRRRVMEKLRDAMRRASPFFVEIKKTEPVQLRLDDILDKYRRVGKKLIEDDYYISEDRQMVMITVRPKWPAHSVDRTAAFVEELRARFARYSSSNTRGVKLVEEYTDAPDADPHVVEIGFTGSYKTNVDDTNEMNASLAPVSGLAFLGVCVCLVLFFRRSALMIGLILVGLIIGILLTFGFTYLAVGELNMITAILGGILMGMGIDFGIHLVYRLRIELAAKHPVKDAVVRTIVFSGPASFAAATGTAAAFASLLFSEFRGFSQFGLLAGTGVFLIGATMYLWVPASVIILDRWWPGLVERFAAGQVQGALRNARTARVPFPGTLLAVSGIAGLVLCGAALGVRFEYNTRALMVENQPSVLLQDEIARRFSISADPVAVYSKTLEEARAVYGVFKPLDASKFSTVDMVVSLFTFVPPEEQQQRNAKILEEWKAELDAIGKSSIPPEYEKQWDEAYAYLDAKPFGIDEIPPAYRSSFSHLPESKPENHGYLTFIYPKVDLWDGKQMLRFAEELEFIHTPNGKTYNAAGGPILFAKLANIVLSDGWTSVMLTALFLSLTLLVDFRSLRDTVIALIPLVMGVGMMLGIMALADVRLNFMNIVVLPIVLGYGVSHGVYLMHRFREGVSPRMALLSVGAAVACSTLTTLAGWLALSAAAHKGLKSMGTTASIGMAATLVVSFTVMMGLLQLIHDRRDRKEAPEPDPAQEPA